MSAARILLPSEHRRSSSFPPSFPHDSVLAGVGGVSPRPELGWLRREDGDRLERSVPEYEREVARGLRVLRARPFHKHRLLLHDPGSWDAPVGDVVESSDGRLTG